VSGLARRLDALERKANPEPETGLLLIPTAAEAAGGLSLPRAEPPVVPDAEDLEAVDAILVEQDRAERVLALDLEARRHVELPEDEQDDTMTVDLSRIPWVRQ
jgi:hypothetical protein